MYDTLGHQDGRKANSLELHYKLEELEDSVEGYLEELHKNQQESVLPLLQAALHLLKHL